MNKGGVSGQWKICPQPILNLLSYFDCHIFHNKRYKGHLARNSIFWPWGRYLVPPSQKSTMSHVFAIHRHTIEVILTNQVFLKTRHSTDHFDMKYMHMWWKMFILQRILYPKKSVFDVFFAKHMLVFLVKIYEAFFVNLPKLHNFMPNN